MANDLLTSDIEMSTPPKRSPFSSMRHPQYRWLYASNMAFFFAMQGQMIVRSYLAFKLTHSALMLGLVNLAMAIPMLLVSPFGGVIADRVEKRRLIIAGQGILITSEFVIFALLLGGKLEFWHLLAFVFVMGCIFPVIMPAIVADPARGALLHHLRCVRRSPSRPKWKPSPWLSPAASSIRSSRTHPTDRYSANIQPSRPS